MKRRGMTMVALAMAVALMAAPAVAQNINLKADVPFDFLAWNVKLNSGNLTLHTISNGVVGLRDPDNHVVAIVLTLDNVRIAEGAKLIFHRYGELYFLTRVETTEASYKIPMSRREKEMARQVSPRQVAVLAQAAVAGE